MRDVGPYTRIGRVANHENCMWASAIFERSGSIQVKKKATLTISEAVQSLEALHSYISSTKDAKLVLD